MIKEHCIKGDGWRCEPDSSHHCRGCENLEDERLSCVENASNIVTEEKTLKKKVSEAAGKYNAFVWEGEGANTPFKRLARIVLFPPTVIGACVLMICVIGSCICMAPFMYIASGKWFSFK